MPAISLALDPAVLVLTQGTAMTGEELRDYEEVVLDIVDLHEAVREAWVTLQCTQEALDALAMDNLLPLRAVLQRRLLEADIESITAHDVERLLYGLIEHSHTIETLLDVEAVLATGPRVSPALTDLPQAPNLGACRATLLQYLAAGAAEPSVARHIYAPSAGCERLLVEGEILEVEAYGSCCFASGAYSVQLHVIASMPSLYMSGEHTTLIDEDLVERLVRAGIKIESYNLLQGAVDFGNLPDVALGADFLASMSQLRIPQIPALSRRVLQAAAEVVCQKRLERTHALRESRGGNSQGLTSGSWSAQRHDINHEYHLHYWRGPGQQVKLASIVPHNDFSIPPV